MVKPFSPRELVARVRGILRRVDGGVGASATGAHGEALRAGRITLNIAEHRVLLDEREVSLTPTEFALLRTLLSSTSRVFTRDLLIAQAYDGNTFVSDRTIDSHVKGVRRKFARLEETADPIETVFGVGYRARELS
jgi:DNA-binding response OmpR family regulator